MTFLLKVEENLIPRRKKEITFHDYAVTTLKNIIYTINPFAPGDFAEKRVLKLVEWFSGHCHAIKS